MLIRLKETFQNIYTFQNMLFTIYTISVDEDGRNNLLSEV